MATAPAVTQGPVTSRSPVRQHRALKPPHVHSWFPFGRQHPCGSARRTHSRRCRGLEEGVQGLKTAVESGTGGWRETLRDTNTVTVFSLFLPRF